MNKDEEIELLRKTVVELAFSLLFARGCLSWMNIAVHGMNAASEENRKQVFPTVADIAGRIEAWGIERESRAQDILTGRPAPVKH